MIDLGLARMVDARSAGEAGQRVFHLRMLGEAGDSAALKLEKEHVLGVRMGLRELLGQLGYSGGKPSSPAGDFPEAPRYEFAVGRLGLGFSEPEKAIVLEAREAVPEEDQDAVLLRVRFSQEQGAALVQQLEEIIAAGRPTCGLCGLPVDPSGHACPKSNGRWQQPVPETPSGDEP